MVFILFLSLCANIYSQADRYDQMNFWTSLKVQNLEIINTPNEEFSPYIWSDYLIYVGLQSKKGLFKSNQPRFFDLKASLLNPEATLPHFVFTNELNSAFHEGPLSWNEDNNRMFFTRADSKDNQAILDTLGRQLLQIYTADYAQGKWSNIIKLPFCTPYENYCHPSIFDHGKKIIFASTKAGGKGKMDLYLAERNDADNWGEVKNLGEQINQEGNQWFPFVLNSQHLFYASDINDGQGLDIYYCSLDQLGSTNNPQRLPFPINTSYDDFGLVFSQDGQSAFLSSNRPDGQGKDDIYKIVFPGDTASKEITAVETTKTAKPNISEKETITITPPASRETIQEPNEIIKTETIVQDATPITEVDETSLPVPEASSQVPEVSSSTKEVSSAAQESTPHTKEVPAEASTKVEVPAMPSAPPASEGFCIIKVKEVKSNLKLSDASINMYIIPSEIANSFQYQVESSASVILLEAMADNVSSRKEFMANNLGQLSITLPKDSFLYFVVKKEGYKEQGTLINSSLNISELILELEKN